MGRQPGLHDPHPDALSEERTYSDNPHNDQVDPDDSRRLYRA